MAHRIMVAMAVIQKSTFRLLAQLFLKPMEAAGVAVLGPHQQAAEQAAERVL